MLVAADALCEEVYALTTRPGDLARLSEVLADTPSNSSAPVVRDFLETRRNTTNQMIAHLIRKDNVDKHMSRLLKDMIKNGGSFPFAAAMYMPSLADLGPIFKEHTTAIMYDISTGKFRFNTAANMAAAQLYVEDSMGTMPP